MRTLLTLALLTSSALVAVGLSLSGGAEEIGSFVDADPTHESIQAASVDSELAEIPSSPSAARHVQTREPLSESAIESGSLLADTASDSATDAVALRVEVEFSDGPPSASTLTVEHASRGPRALEVREGSVQFEDLPGGERVTLTWWSGRPGQLRGRIHEQHLTLPREGLVRVELETPFTSGHVGQVDLTVLTPEGGSLQDLGLKLQPQSELELEPSSLRHAPFEEISPGENQASLRRLEAGSWSVEAPGIGTVGAFQILPQSTVAAVVDLRGVVDVHVRVMSEGTQQALTEVDVVFRQALESGSAKEAPATPDGMGGFRLRAMPGPARLSARDAAGRSVARDVEVPATGGEFVLQLDSKALLQHELLLVHGDEPFLLELEDWVGGEFLCLDGDGRVRDLSFGAMDPEGTLASATGNLTVDEPGRYRWIFPDSWPTSGQWVDFDVVESQPGATVIECAIR